MRQWTHLQQAKDGLAFMTAGIVLLARVGWWAFKRLLLALACGVAAVLVSGMVIFILDVGS